MEKSPTTSRLFLLVYLFGVLFILTMIVLAIWPDYEAASYGFARRANAQLPGLHCPVLMNRAESGVVSLKLANTTERSLSPSIRTEFSSPFALESNLEFVQLAEGETKTFKWTIGPDNIDLNHFIFVKVSAFSMYPTPDRESTCGVFILDVPIRGIIVQALLIVLGLGCMATGLYWLWKKGSANGKLQQSFRALFFLGILLALTLIVSLAGAWLAGVFLLGVILLSILISFNYMSV